MGPDMRMPRCGRIEIDIEGVNIQALQALLQKGTVTVRELVECYLRRIDQVNPYTKSVIETNPDALEIADALDRDLREGRSRGELHGIPFLVKDNIATWDKVDTTAGSSVLRGTKVAEDAHVVTLLRNAGAVLLGHANMSEWASMRATYYSEGYSSRGGQSRNPFNLAENPGGSSSGSAGAVASNMCFFSLGTETDGSVIFPADRNGVVGLKPTVGLTSCRGVIPESESLDTIGVFGRDVADVALVLQLISRSKNEANVSPVNEQQLSSTLLSKSVSNRKVLQGARFGLPQKRIWEAARTDSETSTEYDSLLNAINQIRQAGAEILENVEIPSWREIVSPDGWDWDHEGRLGHAEKSEFTVVKTEFYNGIKEYLRSLKQNDQNINSLEDIIAYNKNHTDEEGGLPGTHPAWPTGQDSFDMSAISKGIKDETYFAALEFMRRKSREEGIDSALQHQGVQLDGLLVPSLADGGAACQVAAKAGEVFELRQQSTRLNETGYPMITLPIGINNRGVPVGLSIIQTAWREDLLIKFASGIEDVMSVRPKPRFLNLNAENYMYVGKRP